MKPAGPGLDAAFLEKQRRELLRLRSSLIAASEAAESEQAQIKSQRTSDALQQEDDAQGLDALEREDNLAGRSVERLQRVNRALRKIEEGSYGLSDESGKPIPRDRLEALPDALNTLSEERCVEGKRR
jgi:DnaK suppressor protein